MVRLAVGAQSIRSPILIGLTAYATEGGEGGSHGTALMTLMVGYVGRLLQERKHQVRHGVGDLERTLGALHQNLGSRQGGQLDGHVRVANH